MPTVDNVVLGQGLYRQDWLLCFDEDDHMVAVRTAAIITFFPSIRHPDEETMVVVGGQQILRLKHPFPIAQHLICGHTIPTVADAPESATANAT